MSLPGRGRLIQSRATSYARPVAICLLFAWLAYLVTVGQPKFELAVFPATVRLHVLFALLAAGYVAYLIIRRRLPGPTLLDLPIACLVLVYILATLDSIYPRVSLEFTLLALAPILAFYAFHDFEFLSTDTLIQGLMCVGAVSALAALVQVAGDYVNWLNLINAVGGGTQLFPPAVPRVHDVGGNVNILAMALNLTLPFAIVSGVQTPSRRERLLAIVISVLILAALFFTLSRGAWLGTIASLMLMGLLYLLRQRDPAQLISPITRSPRRAALIVLPPLLLVFVAVGLVATRWDSRPDWLFRASLSPRYDAMQVGVDIFRDRPYLGAGPGTYPLLYGTYSGDYPVENIHPHNGYLNVVDDIGIAGAIVLLVAGLVLLTTLLRAYREGDVHLRLRLAACMAALASLGVHSLVDSPNTWNTALLPLAVVIALALKLCAPAQASTRMIKIGPRVLLVALLPLLFFSWYRLDGRQAQFHKAVNDLRNGRFEQASEQSTTAAAVDSTLAAAQINAGVSRAILYLVQGDQHKRPPDPVSLEMAKAYFGTAIYRDPRSAIGYANMALILRMQSESSGKDSFKHDAVDAARQALNLAPTDGTTALVAGTVLEWADHMSEAAYAYSRAIIREPSLAQSPFWGANAKREAIRKQALADPDLSPCLWGRASAIYAGFQDDMTLLASRCQDEVDAKPNDPSLRAALAIILQSLGRGDEAREAAEDAANRVPDNPFVLTALGVVRAASGDLQAGREQFAKAATLRDPYDPDAALLLAYTFEPPPPGNNVLRNLHITPEPGPLPKPVVDIMRTAYEHAAPFVFDDGRQRYALGILYYRVRFFRESPTSILIPGEWVGMSSPRALLLEEALHGK